MVLGMPSADPLRDSEVLRLAAYGLLGGVAFGIVIGLAMWRDRQVRSRWAEGYYRNRLQMQTHMDSVQGHEGWRLIRLGSGERVARWFPDR
jgi:hypothetical protein